jgi:hypothetical protein
MTAAVGKGRMNGQVPRKRNPLMYLGGPVIVVPLWWVNPFPYSYNACKSPSQLT